MLKGVNDTPAEARALVRLLKGLPAKINLIPFNPWPGEPLRMLGLGDDRAIFRDRLQRRLRKPGEDAARPRHPGRVRATEERKREAQRASADDARRESGRWTRLTPAWIRRRPRKRFGAKTADVRSTLLLTLRSNLGARSRGASARSSACPGSAGAASSRRLASSLLAWLSTSLYRVQPDEKGVVLRFGQWVATTEPGLHVHLPYPIETVLLPKVTQVNQIQIGVGPSASVRSTASSSRGGQMLTGDENIVEADGTVFWKIRDPGQYPVQGRQSRACGADRGRGRAARRHQPHADPGRHVHEPPADRRRDACPACSKLLDDEQAGVEITQVQLQRVEPPLAVIDAFNDVQRARADQERARNEAEAYANDIMPRARGEAERIRQEAEAYRVQVVNLAHGEADAFVPLLRSYEGGEGRHRLAALSRQRRRGPEEGLESHRRHLRQGRCRASCLTCR